MILFFPGSSDDVRAVSRTFDLHVTPPGTPPDTHVCVLSLITGSAVGGSDCDLSTVWRSSPGTPTDVALCIKGNVHPKSRTAQPAGRHLAALSGGSSRGSKRSSALKDISGCP